MLTTIVRTLISYVFIIVGIRLMGKRQIGDMQPGELVITLLISEIAATPLEDTSQPVIIGATAIFSLVALELGMSLISMKSFFFRKILSGKSAVIIKEGKIDQTQMKKLRMTILDLVELLRAQNVYDISTVDYAVLETNGSLNVLLKTSEQPATVGDLKLSPEKKSLPLPVICDGKIIGESIEALGITSQRVQKLLKKNKAEEEDVFLLSLDRLGNYTLIKKGKEL